MSDILKVGYKLIDLASPKVMSVINVTPDSFYEGSRCQSQTDVLNAVEKSIEHGASILDVGGCSTRPGADKIDEQLEYERVRNALFAIKKEFPEFPLSVDTYRASIVQKLADEFGPFLVNDISGGQDSDMFDVVSRNHLPYILCHFKGTIAEMHNKEYDYSDIITEMIHFFAEKIGILQDYGIRDLVLDPNFGFAKNADQNIDVIREFDKFTAFGFPLLAGVSRKRFICKTVLCETEESLSATSAAHMMLLQKGARLLRAHDTKEAIQVIRLFEKCFHQE